MNNTTVAFAKDMERAIARIIGLHGELADLSKKRPNDLLNAFKVKILNGVLKEIDDLLDDGYRAFDKPFTFSEDDTPTNSDAAMVAKQYIQALESLRSEIVHMKYGNWIYRLSDSDESVRTSPPVSVTRK